MVNVTFVYSSACEIMSTKETTIYRVNNFKLLTQTPVWSTCVSLTLIPNLHRFG